MDSSFEISSDPYDIIERLGHLLDDWKIVFQDTHPSTQILAKNAFHNGERHPSIFFVREQTAGRGRGKRRWLSSPFGRDITMTILFPVDEIKRNISTFSLVGGISVVEILRELTDKKFQAKWPNDIFFLDSKVGGILSELLLANDQNAIAMGIGINVNSSLSDFNTENFFYEINTVSDIFGLKVDIADLIFKIVRRVQSNQNLTQEKYFHDLEQKWLENGWHIGEEVRFRETGADWQTGIADGITSEGYLKIVDNNRQLVTILIEGDVGPLD